MKAKSKKIFAGTAAIIVVAAVAIGGTLSYLTDETERRANNFTFASKSLNAMLTEPKWDGVIDYEYDDDGNITPIYDWIDDDNNSDTPDVPVYGYTDGDRSKPVTDKDDISDTTDRPRKDSTDTSYKPTYGDEQAKNMIPGQAADKNPIITNTGVTDEWVAAKITFVYAEGTEKAGKPLSTGDMQKVLDAIDIDYKVQTSDNWERIGSTANDISQVFYYKKIVNTKDNPDTGDINEQVTTPIFETVKVKSDADNEQIKALENMGGFAIWIEGFAVQNEVAEKYESDDTSETTFKSWGIDNGVVFNNTPTEDAPANVSKPGIIPAK